MLKIPGLPMSRQDAKCNNNVSPAFFPFKSEFLSEFEDDLAAAVRSSARKKSNADLCPSKEKICGLEEFGRRRRRENGSGHVANDSLSPKGTVLHNFIQSIFQFLYPYLQRKTPKR